MPSAWSPRSALTSWTTTPTTDPTDRHSGTTANAIATQSSQEQQPQEWLGKQDTSRYVVSNLANASVSPAECLRLALGTLIHDERANIRSPSAPTSQIAHANAWDTS